MNGPSKVFKGCLPQILFSPFSNTLSQIKLEVKTSGNYSKQKVEKLFHGCDVVRRVISRQPIFLPDFCSVFIKPGSNFFLNHFALSLKISKKISMGLPPNFEAN